MKQSFKFFANTECEYYPCHQGLEDHNCLFCYCPLYRMDCKGNFQYFQGIKDCSKCLVPHRPEGYEYITEKLLEEKLIEERLIEENSKEREEGRFC